MTNKIHSLQFDVLDYQIIRELPGNIRVDAAKIARAVGANERTVRKRINRLLNSHAVKLAGIINPNTFGYVVTAEILLRIEPEYEDVVVEKLLEMPEVSYIAYGQDDHDVSIQAHFKDYREMRYFIRQRLSLLSGVIVTKSSLVPRILHNIDQWMPKNEDFANQ